MKERTEEHRHKISIANKKFRKDHPEIAHGGVRKGHRHSEETKNKISVSSKSSKNSGKFKKGHKLGVGSKATESHRRHLSESHKLFYKNHPEKIANKLQRRVSRPQMKLYNDICSIVGKTLVKLEYCVPTEKSCRYIDIAIPSLSIGIEYDGEQWHKDKNADDLRDKELNALGWNIIHVGKGKIIKESRLADN